MREKSADMTEKTARNPNQNIGKIFLCQNVVLDDRRVIATGWGTP